MFANDLFIIVLLTDFKKNVQAQGIGKVRYYQKG